jgi:hypothetical protein
MSVLDTSGPAGPLLETDQTKWSANRPVGHRMVWKAFRILNLTLRWRFVTHRKVDEVRQGRLNLPKSWRVSPRTRKCGKACDETAGRECLFPCFHAQHWRIWTDLGDLSPVFGIEGVGDVNDRMPSRWSTSQSASALGSNGGCKCFSGLEMSGFFHCGSAVWIELGISHVARWERWLIKDGKFWSPG